MCYDVGSLCLSRHKQELVLYAALFRPTKCYNVFSLFLSRFDMSCSGSMFFV